MIPIERLHYKLDMKLNKLASNGHQFISVENKDLALNEAAIKLVKQKVGLNNEYKLGFDSFKKRYQDLEFLIVPHEAVDVEKVKGIISIFSYDLSKLSQKFFLPTDVYTESSRGSCKNRVVVVEKIAKHDDVSLYLSSTHLQPSFEYQVTFATISSGQLNIYTEQSPESFKIDKAYISYLRYPAKMSLGDVDFDGSEIPKSDCDFPEHLEDELLEIAVMDLALSTENQFATQAAQIRAKQSE